MGWFVCANGIRFRVGSVEMIVPYSDGATMGLASGKGVLLTLDETTRLIAQIEAENADAIAVKEQMFHHASGAFLLSDVRGWTVRPEEYIGRELFERRINVHGPADTQIRGSDIPRFLAAMGVPNEPT